PASTLTLTRSSAFLGFPAQPPSVGAEYGWPSRRSQQKKKPRGTRCVHQTLQSLERPVRSTPVVCKAEVAGGGARHPHWIAGFGQEHLLPGALRRDARPRQPG